MDANFHRRRIALAFYERPKAIRSSAEIISEARAEMAGKRNGLVTIAPGGIRALDTKRPFTPRESQRTLFGRAGRLGVSRPPSAVSLKYLQTEKIDGELNNSVPWFSLKPNFGTKPKQDPSRKPTDINKFCIPTICHSLSSSQRVKLPNLPQSVAPDWNASRAVRLQFHAASLVNLSEEEEEKLSGGITDQSQTPGKTCNSETKHYESGTVESTPNSLKTNPIEIYTANTEKSSNVIEAQVNKSFSARIKSFDKEVSVYAEGWMGNMTVRTDGSNTASNALSDHTCMPDHKNKGFAGNSEKCSRNGVITKEIEINSECYVKIIQLIKILNLEAENENNESNVISIIQHLYEYLEANKLLGSKLNSKSKAQILRSLYKFVERSSNELLLEVAHVVLALNVSGKNLAGVCKLVFKVSRNDKNDHLFLKGNFLELFVNALGTAEPLEDAEACIYGYGALKFLTMNSILLSKLLSFGALELMVLHLKVINKWRMEGCQVSEQTSHALFQLTGALRNVAGEEEDPFPKAFVTSGVVRELCSTIYLFSCDLDIISNVSRTMSILSTHDVCCSAIIHHENSLKTLVKLLKKFPGRQDIVVRLSYVLGNLMAKSNKARVEFYSDEDAITCLMDLLHKYILIDSSNSTTVQNKTKTRLSSSSTDGSAEDVLIKIVRIIANMSISPIVGLGIVGKDKDQDGDSGICMQIVDSLLDVLKSHQVTKSPELVMSCLATLNNLSFWAVAESGGYFSKRQLEVAEVLHSYVMDDHKDCLVETIRVFGNLTQSQEVRNYTAEHGILERLILLLCDHMNSSRDLLLANVGVLVNIMADADKRRILANHNGISWLIEILEKTNGENWILASLICQVIWNYTIESKNLYSDLGKNETDKLVSVLADYLDEERYFGISEGSEIDPAISMSSTYQEWDEFAAVATDLLEKIEAFMDSCAICSVLLDENFQY